MPKVTIYIANKNYSSWSLRGWLTVRMAGVEFDEVVVPLRESETAETILRYSPSGRLPALHYDDDRVWDSLAIGEFMAEMHPEAGLWPDDRHARAVARSVAAEMHSGFRALRTELPLNVRRVVPDRNFGREAQADITRITSIWRDCRDRFGAGGPFLFGRFTIADAAFAPVASRFRTYGIDLDETAAAYRDAVLDLPAMKEWASAAKNEPMEIEAFELD
jgi:glutathione S-transferase